MYRCRIIAVFLSLAVMASALVFTASADDGSPIQIQYQVYNKTNETWDARIYTRPLQEGFFSNSGTYGIRIVGFYVRPTSQTGLENYYISFRVCGYNTASSEFQFSLGSNSVALQTTNDQYVSHSYGRHYYAGRADNIANSPTTFYTPSSNTRTVVLGYTFSEFPSSGEWYGNITLTNPIEIHVSNYTTAFWPYLDDICIQQSSELEFEYYNRSLFMQTSIYGFLTGSYNYVAMTYNPVTDQIEQTNAQGNYFDALLGSIQSLSADAQAQAAKQEKANEAGFNDVLDDAYDLSSPGSIVDFLGIASISSWNEEAYEDVQSDAITYWFSQSCKDNIDSVPVVRGQEPQIIDFYSSHISEYWEALGIDTADSSGN